MKIGVQLAFQQHRDYPDREMYKHEVRLSIDAEEMGFDTLWPVEHHFFDYSMCPDNMQYLSFIAARTHRVQLGTGAIILPWNNPMRVVEKMVLLDHLSDGRAILGLGRGLSKREYRGFGVAMAEARERFDEAAEMIVAGLETGVVEADGKFYKQARVEIRPRPFKSFKDRRYMVAMSPDSLDVAAKMGLGVMLFSQFQWEKVEPGLTAYRQQYRTAHGEDAPFPIINDFVVCHPDKRKAEEIARKHIVGYYWSIMEHYELTGSHFKDAGKAYDYYAKGAEAINATGHDAVIEEFLDANLWGDPDLIIEVCAAAVKSSVTST